MTGGDSIYWPDREETLHCMQRAELVDRLAALEMIVYAGYGSYAGGDDAEEIAYAVDQLRKKRTHLPPEAAGMYAEDL